MGKTCTEAARRFSSDLGDEIEAAAADAALPRFGRTKRERRKR